MWPKPKEGIGTAQNKAPLQSVVYQVVPPRYVVEGGISEAVSDGTRSSSRDDISDSEDDLAVHGKAQIPSAPASMGSTGLKHARSQRSSAQPASSTFKTFRKTSNPDSSKHRTPLEQRLTFSPSIPAFELVDLASPTTDPVNPFATTHAPPSRTTPHDNSPHKMLETTSVLSSLSTSLRNPLDPLSPNSHSSSSLATYEVDSVVDLASTARSAFGTQGSGSRLAIDRISMDSERYNAYGTDEFNPASSRSDSASNAFQSAPLAFKVTKYSPLSARRRHFSNAPKYRSISYMKEHKIDPEASRTEKTPHYRPFSYSSEATYSEPSTELRTAALASAPTSPRVAKPSGTGFNSNPISHFTKAFQHNRVSSHGSNRTSSTSSSIPSTHSPAPADTSEFSRISASRSPPPKRKRRYSTSAIDDVIDGEGNEEPLHELTDGDDWHPSAAAPARHASRTGRYFPVTQASDESSDFSAQMVPYEYDDWAHVEHRNSDSDSDPSTHSVSSFHHQRNRRSRRVSIDADTESTGYQTAVMDTDSAGDDHLGSSPDSILGTHLTSTRGVVNLEAPLSGRRRRGAMTGRGFRPGLGSVSDSATDSAGESSDLGSMTAEFDSSDLTNTGPTNSSVTSSAASTASSIPSLVSANSTQSNNSLRSLGSGRSTASRTSSESDRRSAAPIYSALAEGHKKNRSTSHEILPVEIDVRRESKRRRRSEDAVSVIHGNNPVRSNTQQSHTSSQYSIPALQPSVQSTQAMNQYSSAASLQAASQFQAPNFSMSEGNLPSDTSQTFSGRIKVRSPRRSENHHLGSPLSTSSVFSNPSSSSATVHTSGSSSTTVGTSSSSHSSGSSSHLIKPASDITMGLQSMDGTSLKWTPRAPVLPATEITLPKWASTGSVVPARTTSSAAMQSLSSPTLKNMSPRSSHTDEETKTPLRKRTSGASVITASSASHSNSNLSMKHSGGTPIPVSPQQASNHFSTSTGSQLNLGGMQPQNFLTLQEDLQIAFPIPLHKLNGRRSRRIFTSSIKDGGEETDGTLQPSQPLQPRQPNMVGIVDAFDSDTSYSADVDNDEDEESAFASAYDPSSGPALLDPYHLRPRGGVTPKPNPKPTRLLRDAQLSERSTGSPGLAPMLSNLPANFQTILSPRYQGAAGRTIAQRMAEGNSQEYASDTAIMNDPPQERGPRMGVGYVTDDDFCYQPPIVGHADFLVAMPMLQQQSGHFTSTMNPSSSNISIESISSSRAPMTGLLASTSEIYSHAPQVTPSNIGLQDAIPSGLRASVSSTSMDSSTAMLADIDVSVEPSRGGRSNSFVMKSTVHLVQTYQNIQRAINERNELEQAGTRQKAGTAPYYYPKIDEIVGGGRYKVLGYLGRGSFGVVVKAEVLALPSFSSGSSAMSSDGEVEDGDDASAPRYDQAKSPAASSALSGNEMDTSSQSEASGHLKPRSVVAIKIGRKGASFLQQGRCEVSILERIHQFQAKQPNNDLDLFVQPLDTFFHNEHLCIVFELLADSLFDLVKYSWEVRPERPGLSLRMVRKMTHQILCALVTLKNLKIIHSDLKPENIALAQPNRPRLKLLDFGSSCFIADSHLNQFPYIQSRYYRAPEVLLGTGYSCSIDMWSLGCIIAELYLGRPIFEGSNSVTQLYCIIEVLGMPTDHVLRNAVHLNRYFNRVGVDDQGHTVLDPVVKNHPFNSTSLKEIIATKKEPNNPLHLQYFTDIIARMLDWDPNNRITPIEAINHNFILYGPKTSPDGT